MEEASSTLCLDKSYNNAYEKTIYFIVCSRDGVWHDFC